MLVGAGRGRIHQHRCKWHSYSTAGDTIHVAVLRPHVPLQPQFDLSPDTVSTKYTIAYRLSQLQGQIPSRVASLVARVANTQY
jgi:hypothetical protein